MSVKKRFGGFGTCSIMMIFVILCLTTFGILSLISAQEDLHLSNEAALATERYYAADAQTDETLATIDKVLTACKETARQNSLSQEEYETIVAQNLAELVPLCKTTGNDVCIEMTMGQRQTLRTDLTLLPYYLQNNYRIESRLVVTNFEWEDEESPVFELYPQTVEDEL